VNQALALAAVPPTLLTGFANKALAATAK